MNWRGFLLFSVAAPIWGLFLFFTLSYEAPLDDEPGVTHYAFDDDHYERAIFEDGTVCYSKTVFGFSGIAIAMDCK